MKVLFLCKGNRGRSQIAEAIFNKIHSNNLAKSAGTEEHHEGEDLPSKVIEVLLDVGIDASHQKVKKLTSEMVDSADKIIILCGLKDCESISNLLKNKDKIEFWNIPDPEGKKIDKLRETRELLKKKIEQMSSV